MKKNIYLLLALSLFITSAFLFSKRITYLHNNRPENFKVSQIIDLTEKNRLYEFSVKSSDFHNQCNPTLKLKCTKPVNISPPQENERLIKNNKAYFAWQQRQRDLIYASLGFKLSLSIYSQNRLIADKIITGKDAVNLWNITKETELNSFTFLDFIHFSRPTDLYLIKVKILEPLPKDLFESAIIDLDCFQNAGRLRYSNQSRYFRTANLIELISKLFFFGAVFCLILGLKSTKTKEKVALKKKNKLIRRLIIGIGVTDCLIGLLLSGWSVYFLLSMFIQGIHEPYILLSLIVILFFLLPFSILFFFTGLKAIKLKPSARLFNIISYSICLTATTPIALDSALTLTRENFFTRFHFFIYPLISLLVIIFFLQGAVKSELNQE